MAAEGGADKAAGVGVAEFTDGATAAFVDGAAVVVVDGRMRRVVEWP